ncbi:Adenylate and Guanylate cyclase catalytic domain containing protein [Tritrichomonas foetus]|uniref:Adenylate and Guanylate cyclase catalytic domain containing protein n=1 Tax=Tritrichomonas foetus TaxID=1144522 RepID=A0A1J4JX00_9EUKA|nr:Adenylate and Guanylate cyclase catalytic domain containing protein [Tritrichomonas foetus]|eukprot:OHT02062.1 Adenylate and Guanylate cyclase catalytic domain containing protein [Tritrichomonas foetus]
MIKFNSVSLVFRPFSLMTVLHKPQILFSLLSTFITFLTALSSQLSFYFRIGGTIISAILYFVNIHIILLPGSFLSDLHKKSMFSSSLTSGCFLILVVIYDIINYHAQMVELFVFIFAFVIFFLSSYIVRRRIIISRLKFLEHKGDDINNYNSLNQFLHCIIFAFEQSHPVLNDWTLLKDAANKYDEHIEYWLVFGKFAAIYPEESKTLAYIIHSIQTRNFRGFIAKQTIAQAQTVLTQREGSLSPELKLRLAKTARQVHYAKRKLRHVWDLAIQSNTAEMDSSINNAYVSVNRAHSNFVHLFNQYPNNRFVARAYARFIYEVEGDQQAYCDWCEKIRNLQRGILVHPDRTNLLGMHAFPILPMLSQTVLPKANIQSDSDQLASESLNEIDDTIAIQVNEQISVIQDRIRLLNIPAVNCIVTWMSILYFGLILIPAVGLMAYSPIFLDDFTIPLNYMYNLSFARCAAFMLPAFGHHWICENVPLEGANTTFFPVPNYTGFYLSSFNGSSDTKGQIQYLVTMTSNSIEQISNFRGWAPNDSLINRVHRLVFDDVIPYTFYQNKTITRKNISLQTAIMEITLKITELMKQEPSLDLISSTYLVGPMINSYNVSEYITNALESLTTYLTQKHHDIDNIILFVIMFLCIVYTVTIAGLLIFMIENLENANKEVYQCLTALPKNVVSAVAESMKLIAKEDEFSEGDDDDEYYSKQDENIIKVFSSASDISVTKSTERIGYIIFNVLLIICVVVLIVLVCEIFLTISKELQINAPHLNYVLGSVSQMFASIGILDNLVTQLCGYENPLTTWDRMVIRTQTAIGLFMTYYNLAQYGGKSLDEPPYKGFSKAYEAASEYFDCNGADTIVPLFYNETYKCFSIDIQINLMYSLINLLINPLQNGESLIYPNNPIFITFFPFGVEIYEKLFFPMFDKIVTDIIELLKLQIPRLRNPSIFLLIVCFLLVLAVYYEAHKSSQKIKFALSLLLQCPPNVVMQTAKVMDILSGEFGDKSHDGTTRHREFFDAIVHRIPDSVIIMNDEFVIESVNKASERIYRMSEDELLGKNARDFFLSEQFSSSTKRLFEEITPESHEEAEVEYKKNENDLSYLWLKFMRFKANYVMTARDITQTQAYKQLIHDEKEKSDKLLSSILPPKLITRVQNGEKNISFSVQSATILFLDIVEFTPWCAANTAQMIMSTLNIMFRELDSKLLRHSTITKLKCIGDCYMCAGGIFVEVNQPAVHAKEVVEFGLEAIQCLLYINEKYSLKLRIRVGINTGGPLVAGVFGTEKPTFEILGPAINMAQQMEHHGVPMLVHISRSTYELIYGGSFIVKERGQIEIKNGTVSTYLVSGKNV